LAGTLTYPKTGAPFAAVLLLPGSGPQDRDEAIMGHRPFLVLSDCLTRLGSAVLRVDDRGMGKSSGDFSKATYEDKVAGVELLKTRKEIEGGESACSGIVKAEQSPKWPRAGRRTLRSS
jgi:hypothetical protein